MTLRFSDAYNGGYDAYENSVGFDNPYTPGTDSWHDWEDGWGDAWAYWNDDPAQGARAYDNGLKLSDNPYDPTTQAVLHELWYEGWMESLPTAR